MVVVWLSIIYLASTESPEVVSGAWRLEYAKSRGVRTSTTAIRRAVDPAEGVTP